MNRQHQSSNPGHEAETPERPALVRDRVHEILDLLGKVNILIVGDACLDVYWHADMKLSELSRETPHFPLPVVEERFSPGACANAAACMSALGVNSVRLLTVTGHDWRGRELLQECKNHGIDTSAVISSSLRLTPAYCKPVRRGISDIAYEDPRIDFENRSALPEELEAEFAMRLREATATVDAIAVSDQLDHGVVTPALRDVLSELSRDGMPVVADSRTRISLFKDIITKPNEHECHVAVESEPHLAAGRTRSNRELTESAARALSRQTGAPVCVTLGPNGAVWATASESLRVPGVRVTPPVDTVGAGDCFLSALTAALATGCTGAEAASLANLAAAVTIKKLRTTGTATPDEILKMHETLDDEGAVLQ